MRTISVREAAQILDLTPRAVTYRIDKGQLKGQLVKNEVGTPEWRIQVNAEIMEALKRKGLGDKSSDKELNFAPQANLDVIDIDVAESATETEESVTVDTQSANADVIKVVAEQLIKPLVERLEAQTAALMEKDKIIAEQAVQLRLLPDLERQAKFEKEQADKERGAVQLVVHESEALKKQVVALEDEKTKAQEALKELAELKSKVEKLQQPFWRKLFGN